MKEFIQESWREYIGFFRGVIHNKSSRKYAIFAALLIEGAIFIGLIIGMVK
ncbi:MAG: hypothetical protein GXO02_03300 [Epsilonproteobacteria bacterium]|nr:hypothetical protein [Campylobacterota bacterium]